MGAWFVSVPACENTGLPSQVFRKLKEAELAVKEHGATLPRWAAAINAPGRGITAASKSIDNAFQVILITPSCQTPIPLAILTTAESLPSTATSELLHTAVLMCWGTLLAEPTGPGVVVMNDS